MFVGVVLPRVEVQDLRPEVPPEQSLVVSSGHKASLLVLDVSADCRVQAGKGWRGVRGEGACAAVTSPTINTPCLLTYHPPCTIHLPHPPTHPPTHLPTHPPTHPPTHRPCPAVCRLSSLPPPNPLSAPSEAALRGRAQLPPGCHQGCGSLLFICQQQPHPLELTRRAAGGGGARGGG
jgi:hypothetical protein